VPLAPAHSDFSSEIGFYIEGSTGKGSFGLPFQLDCLEEHGLRATYFVESLFAGVAGPQPLKEIVALIQARGQEVQLHCHTEWLGEIKDPALPPGFRQYMRQFSEADQTAIIAKAAASLREAGAARLCAFRAGSYGADLNTLRALRNNGIRFDSSHNACYLDSACGLDTGGLLTQPQLIEGVLEFPVSFFQDYPGHFRHAQLCACSFEELAKVLLEASRSGWYAFVIVLHGSELLGERASFDKPDGPNAIHVRRFRKLCEFLARNRDQFHTAVFSEIEPQSVPASRPLPVLQSGMHRTAWRMLEQLAGRVL
jgi:hypothetical protein